MYSAYGAYGTFLGIHSILRWAIVVLALLAVVRALAGWLGHRRWAEADTIVGRLLVVSLDIQLLLGLAMYARLSPIVKAAFTNLTLAMQNRMMRFWLVEHPAALVAAVILAHVGLAKAKRAGGTLAQRAAALYFGLALAIILTSIPWPFFSYGRSLWPAP
jgi:hypothetical protein